ncbi:ketopantoate reductase family protein [Enterococcus olivae]
MEIQTVSVIGMGALGAMFAAQMQKHLSSDQLRIVADKERIKRYEEGLYVNGEVCHFAYFTPEQEVIPADLVIIAVKHSGLKAAVKSAKKHVGKKTMVLSLLNGILSEQMLAEAFGKEKVICCVAQGMDARRSQNRIDYENMGLLSFGEEKQPPTERVKTLTRFFDKVEIAYETPENMLVKIWSKFMLNCGVNQAAMVFDTNYGGLQKAGSAREAMIKAMKEVLQLAQAEGIALDETEITYWLDVLATLSAESFPSMKQDADAKRYSEVTLFSGTVLRLAEKHEIEVPVNYAFYQKIKEIESKYEEV